MNTRILATVMVLCLGVSNVLQTPSFERQALASVQHMLASGLDTELPKRPFAAWFNQLIGPEAGVVWQLTECGKRVGNSNEAGQDLPACTEVNASLPDGSKVIVVITVGTFKKGLTGKPEFFRAVVEKDEQLYQVTRLRDLSEVLLTPKERLAEKQPVDLPALDDEHPQVKVPSYAASLLPTGQPSDPSLESIPIPKAPAAETPSPQGVQRIEEGVLRGNAITKIKPVYPLSAKKMNALGAVEVQITISEEGKVIEATAISGHMALRGTAMEAAYKWAFKPTTINGMPVKVQSILTFVFSPSSK